MFLSYEIHLEGSSLVEFHIAKLDMKLVINVCIQCLNDLGHQLFGSQLKNLVGHVHPVDHIAIRTQTGRCLGTTGIFDDYSRIAAIDERLFGIPVISIAQTQSST